MKKFKKIGITFLVLAFVLCIGSSLHNFYVQAAWTEVEIESEYDFATKFRVPEREVVISGKKVKADAVVKIPDGTLTKKNTITLDVAGMYTLVYTAESEGNSYVDEITFQVYKDLYSFETNKSSAVYGKYEHAKTADGLLIRLAEGDKFHLNEPIDVGSIKSTEAFIHAFATPTTVGESEFETLYFQFTDAHDPTITMSICATSWWANRFFPSTFYTASVYEQTYKGIYDDGVAYQQGDVYKRGANTAHSWGLGHERCTYPDEQSILLRMDNSTNIIYTNEKPIIDFDNYDYFERIWEGFPSGKAYLTIWGTDYSAETAGFCLSKVGNVDLTAKKVMDVETPIITVDTDYDTMPDAVKGGTYQILPSASAFDSYSGACEVKTSVWYNYHNENAAIVKVKDGTFATSKIGTYAIVYEATDKAGNIGREILWIKSKESLAKPTIALKTEPKKSGVVGGWIRPAEYTYESSSGTPTINAYVKFKDKTYDMGKGYLPEKKGTYTIRYEIVDVAGQVGTYEYKYKVKMGDRPVLVDEVEFDDYLVSGSAYIFPKVYFNDYRSGKLVRKEATGKIIDATGEKKVKAGDKFELEVENNCDNVKIIFECEKATYEVQRPTIKAWDQINGRTKLVLENYFLGNGVSYEYGESMTIKAEQSNGGWKFANKLVAENFTTEIQGIGDKADFESLVLELKDSKDATKKLTLELVNTRGFLTVKVGDKVTALPMQTDFSSGNMIPIKYVGNKLYVCGKDIPMDAFKGFPSKYTYFSVNFKGATTNAAYNLAILNGQAINGNGADRIGPKISVLGAYGGSMKKGTTVVLPIAVAGDVMNPNYSFTMTVKNGTKIVKDVNGKKLENVDPTVKHKIKLNSFGQYELVYKATEEFSERESTFSYIIHVNDDVEPKITFSGKLEKKAKVGDVVSIPNYTLSDNITAKENLTVMQYVFCPNGVLLTIPESSNAITTKEAGKYEFMILVMDEAQTLCNKTWTVTVTEN